MMIRTTGSCADGNLCVIPKPTCGDGIVQQENNEQCEQGILNGMTCLSFKLDEPA